MRPQRAHEAASAAPHDAQNIASSAYVAQHAGHITYPSVAHIILLSPTSRRNRLSLQAVNQTDVLADFNIEGLRFGPRLRVSHPLDRSAALRLERPLDALSDDPMAPWMASPCRG